MKYRIFDLTEFMDAYTSNYLKQGKSETLKKLYCLNLTKEQDREYKLQQKKFHIPFDVSKLTEGDRDFLAMLNFEHTNLIRLPIAKLA